MKTVTKVFVVTLVLAGVAFHFLGVPDWDIFRLFLLVGAIGAVNFICWALWAMSDGFTFWGSCEMTRFRRNLMVWLVGPAVIVFGLAFKSNVVTFVGAIVGVLVCFLGPTFMAWDES